MQPGKITKRIKDKALELLDQFLKGLRCSELHAKISASIRTSSASASTGSPRAKNASCVL